MHPSRPVDIVLLGAGHAHLEVLRGFALRPEPGVRLTLITREPETLYCGMLPGLIRNEYTHRQAHIDLAPLAALANARLVVAEATAFDPDARTIAFPARPDVAFDLLSIDVGGAASVPAGSGVAVKPTGQFLEHLSRMETELPAGVRIAVVCGDPDGVELALALAVRFAARWRLVLVSATAEPLARAPSAARRAVRQALVDAGVELVSGVTATGLADGRLSLSDGSYIEAATALWARRVEGPPFLAASGLACDSAGCIRVASDLRSVSHPHIFAAGDGAALESNHRSKAGVGAMGAGEVLAENLRRAATGKVLRRWKPRRHGLSILGLGRGRAVAWRYGIAVQGHKIWWLKDRIDRTWMRRYTEIFPVSSGVWESYRFGAPSPSTDPARGISRLLRRLGIPQPPVIDAAVGHVGGGALARDGLAAPPADRNDDLAPIPGLLTRLDGAAVMKPPLGKLLVQSVAQLGEVVDDPYLLGQIAAAHGISEIYSLGAEPWTAAAVVSAPAASAPIMRADWFSMLQGASEILRADGCALIGSQLAEGSQMALGLAVTGLADAGKILRKSGLQPGDQLILTKPLGTGVVLAGQRRGNTRTKWLLAAIESMRTTNASAARIAALHRLHAASDVAYSGLAACLLEMLQASGVAAVIRLAAIPFLPGARALVAHGIADPRAGDHWRTLGDAPEIALLADPQTSGGLLLGLPPTRASACLSALQDAGLNAAIIGEVEPARDGTDRLRLE